MSTYSTLAVTGSSSISGNTANVSPPAFALASGIVVGSPSNQSTLGRCERETSRSSSTKETLHSHMRPLAVQRMRVRVYFFHADSG